MTSTYAFSTEDDIRRVVQATRQVERTPQFQPRRKLNVPVIPGGGGGNTRRFQCVRGVEYASHQGKVLAIDYDKTGAALNGTDIAAIFTDGFQNWKWESGASVGDDKIYELSLAFWGNPMFVGQLFWGNKTYVISGPANETLLFTLAGTLNTGGTASATINGAYGIVLDSTPQAIVSDGLSIVPATNLASGTIVLGNWTGDYDSASIQDGLAVYTLANAACPVVE